MQTQLGVALFRKSGRSLQLTNEGDALFAAVCFSRQAVCDTLERLLNPESPTQRLRIAATGQLLRTRLLPALASVSLDVEALTVEPITGLRMLRGGQLDALLAHGTPPTADLSCLPQPASPLRIYMGRGHPLFQEQRVDWDRASRYPFVATPPAQASEPAWPADVPRKIGLVVDSAHAVLQACTTGKWLALMSTESAEEGVRLGTLRSVEASFLGAPRVALFFSRHRSQAIGALAGALAAPSSAPCAT